MPKVECTLVFEGNHGESGEVLLTEIRELLEEQGFVVVDLTLTGTTLTQDELDKIRWHGEGGPECDDDLL